MEEKKDLIGSFRTQLQIFNTSVGAATLAIASILRNTTQEEDLEIIKILSQETDREKVRTLALVADEIISNVAVQGLDPKKYPNEQIIIDYLFSVSKNPSQVLISQITEGLPEHQEKLGEILLNISKEYSDEQTFAAIDRCPTQTLINYQSVMSYCLLGRTKFVDTINKRISELSKNTAV